MPSRAAASPRGRPSRSSMCRGLDIVTNAARKRNSKRCTMPVVTAARCRLKSSAAPKCGSRNSKSIRNQENSMCTTCGCGHGETRIEGDALHGHDHDHEHMHEHVHADGTRHVHAHTHDGGH